MLFDILDGLRILLIEATFLASAYKDLIVVTTLTYISILLTVRKGK